MIFGVSLQTEHGRPNYDDRQSLNVINVDSMNVKMQLTGWEGERETRGRDGALSSSRCEGRESGPKECLVQITK